MHAGISVCFSTVSGILFVFASVTCFIENLLHYTTIRLQMINYHPIECVIWFSFILVT